MSSLCDPTMTAPWASDTHDLLRATLSHIARASLVMPDGETFALDLEGGTVAWDETRSPRVQASLTCKVPGDQALLDRMDPRTGARLVIDAGYRRPDGTQDVQTFVDLGLRSRRVTRPNDQMTLTAAGDEALVIDDAPTNGGSVNRTTTTVAIVAVLQLIFPGLAVDTTGTPAGAAVSQAPLGDKWTTVLDLADRIEAQVYDNGLRNWYIKVAPTVAALPALDVEVGTEGTIISSDAGMDREEGWANRVFLTYNWTTTAAGVDTPHSMVSVKSITSGVYAATVGNTRTHEETRQIPATQTSADLAATSLVKRTVTRGRTFTVQTISAYWLRPGMTLCVDLPLGGEEWHIVAGVDFDLADGTMRVTTRLPDNTGTIGA